MRWKQHHHHHGHYPRQMDLVAIFALLIIIITACKFFSTPASEPSAATFIVPSQSVRW